MTEENGKFAVCVLASGSKGNAIYMEAGDTAVLFDAGLSGVELERRMRSRLIEPDRLNAIIVSHEHSDHIRGVGVLARRYDLPVYTTEGTLRAAEKQLGRIDCLHLFECGNIFNVNGLSIHPFSISHDAEDPAGFIVSANGTKVGIATDLGIATGMVKTHLKTCSMLIIEANHDIEMLENGPYPWPLKQRIKSRSGHLSNESARDLVAEILHDDLKHLVLAHLSETNNTPKKALAVISKAVNGHGASITAATQGECGQVFRL
ncbi:MAG: MBL fold metallo-hydrolase [Deltaproteobacteria bacterium]|nr:MBL fold metallo-hydrolase [Deltaproteobacteria bacterium]